MKVVNRIKSNEDFATTVKKGRTLKNQSYVVHYLKNGLTACRIGLSVSKRLGNAVVRNRTKRQVRAMCDSLIDYANHTFDIVIIVRQDFLNRNFEDNKKALSDVLSEIGIIK